MKQMGDLLPHDPTLAPRDELDRMLQRESQQQKEKLQKSIEIQKLWQLMSSLYGYKWTKAYGDEADPDKVWQAALSDVSYEQMMFGMNLITKQGKEWPPSAPEFRKISLKIEEGLDMARPPNAGRTKEHYRGITHKRSEAEIEKAVSKIGNLRGLLNGT